MRLLLDNNLSPRLAGRWLGSVGIALSVCKPQPTPVVLRAALDEDRVLISADTDFGAWLAASHATGPSVVLVRRVVGRRVMTLAAC